MQEKSYSGTEIPNRCDPDFRWKVRLKVKHRQLSHFLSDGIRRNGLLLREESSVANDPERPEAINRANHTSRRVLGSLRCEII